MPTRLKLGLLGNGLQRSRARHLHELIGELHGLDVSYQPMDLAGRETVAIDAELGRCARSGFDGVNVTHPYKGAAFLAVTERSGLPPGLTSINTVLFADRGMTGANTDCSGFCRGYAARFGDAAAPGRVLLLGAGGVGKAIAFALGRLGAQSLVIHDIDADAATQLAAELAQTGMTARPAGDDADAEMRAADGLVNATPIGMFQYPGCAIPRDKLGGQQWAFDAVYTPVETEFLVACRQHAIETLSGFELFLYQGLDAFELFSGIAPDADKIKTAFLERYPLE